MCLAVFKPADKEVSDEYLKAGWQINSGGAGFAYVRKGKMMVVKELMKLQEFLDAYRLHQSKNKKSDFLIHFRIPSMGSHGASNTHPFLFEHGALIHNGTIHGTGAIHGTGLSDTGKFTERYGPKLTFENVEKNKRAIDDALGYNKIAILYTDGRHQIINESDGHWMDGVWYSNNFFLSMAQRQARNSK